MVAVARVIGAAAWSQHFGVSGIPTMFVLGRDGAVVGKVVVGKVVGGGAQQHEELLRLVERARR